MQIPNSLRQSLAGIETLLVALVAAGFAGAADAVLATRPVTVREIGRTALVGGLIGVAALVRRSPWARASLPESNTLPAAATTPTTDTTAAGVPDVHRDRPPENP